MKASGKGAKSALPAAGDKDKDKGKKKKPPKNVLHGCTMEAALSRLGADGVKGMLELSKVNRGPKQRWHFSGGHVDTPRHGAGGAANERHCP